MEAALRERLHFLARTELLLVASDYDGTLAEIVLDPAQATPHPVALGALRALGETPWTRTAIISGRSLKDLVRFLGAQGQELLVGSHGEEWVHPGVPLTSGQQNHLRQVAAVIWSIADSATGAKFELKPAGVALHFRAADPVVAEEAVARALEVCGGIPGVWTRHGSKVVEFMVVDANKGDAFARVRRATGATGVLFAGDDRTDEDVFLRLGAADVGIKVGDGTTAARHRVAGVQEVAAILEELVALRREMI